MSMRKQRTGVSMRMNSIALLIVPVMYVTGSVLAASHSDAPSIKQDPQTNITDVYAFIGRKYNAPSEEVLNVLVQVRPFSEPGDGPHYDRFADDARYSIHITDPNSAETLIRYDFRFSPVDRGLKNENTILSYGLGTEAGPIQEIGDARQNFTQTYGVWRRANGGATGLGTGFKVGIPNVGNNVTPFYNDADGLVVSGASDEASLDTYTQQAVHETDSGEVLFAGPRDDAFYADVPAIFDLLNVRILDNNGDLGDGLGQDGGGVNGFKGFNVLAFGIQIPLEMINGNGNGNKTVARTFNSVFFGEQTGVGVYASVSRPQFQIRRDFGRSLSFGPWVQGNRMGNPLFNEAFVALKDKDNFNRWSPEIDDIFATYAENPELAFLVNFVYGTAFAESGRADLVNIFIPEVLRVNTTTGPVTLSGEPGFDRLGFIGGDVTAGVSSGWPNGRRPGDDVIDIGLTAVASGPSYDPITIVGDNTAANDLVYNQVFPYLATPHSGTTNRKDPS